MNLRLLLDRFAKRLYRKNKVPNDRQRRVCC